MDKHAAAMHSRQDSRGVKGTKSDMSDHPDKKHKQRKISNSRSQQVRQHHQSQSHHHRHHQSDESLSQDFHSAEENIVSDHHQKHRHLSDNAKTSYMHHHKNRHVSLSETSSFSTSSSSSLTSSSLSSSSTSLSSSPSSSSSSSSSSFSSSASSSSSSKNGSEFSGRHAVRRTQLSQSCTDISRKQKGLEERDDMVPLIKGHQSRSYAKQRRKSKSSQSGLTKGSLKKRRASRQSLGRDGSFRKTKSMDNLTTPRDKEENKSNEQERNMCEVKKNVMKEKMKFSAFLNEITRQVLSPMRLTTLGVTDAQRPSSPGQISNRSREADVNSDKLSQHRSRPASAESVSSSKQSHSSKHSNSPISQSKSFPDQYSASQPSHTSHGRRSSHSRSPTSEHRFNFLPCRNHPHRSHSHHHPHHKDCNEPDHQHRHRDQHTTGHHHRHRHHPGHPGDYYNPTHHHGEQHSKTDHHCHGHDHLEEFCHVYGQHHGDSQDRVRQHKGYHSRVHHLEDHHSQGHHQSSHPNSHSSQLHPYEQPEDHSSQNASYHHGNHHKRVTQHHHGDHASRPNPAHGDHHGPDHYHSQGDCCTDLHRHHQSHSCDQPTNYHFKDSQHHHGGHHHHHKDHKNEPCDYPHEDLHSLDHHHHQHEDHHGHHHHHHGDHHGLSHFHHHRTHKNETHGNPHEDHHGPGHHHHHRENHGHPHHHDDHNKWHHDSGDHHSKGHQCDQGDHHSKADQHHPEDYHKSSHQQHHGGHSEPQTDHVKSSNTNHEALDDHNAAPKEHSTFSSRENLASHLSKNVSHETTSSPSNQEEEQTSFTGPTALKEKKHGLERIMILHDQNEGLHQSLMKTAVRMECLGEEFLSGQKLLETELQRTRMELNLLMDRFKRLHDTCSSTQQSNTLLEQKLHSVACNMECERERLNLRISELTQQLADAKLANNMEALTVTSVLHQTNLSSHPDEAISQTVPAIAPPPAQFMDCQNFGRDKASGHEQALGSVPEEEESDWSEMGEDAPRIILTGSNRAQSWRHQEVDIDKDSESGGEDIIRCPSPRLMQIPQLQFMVHNEFLPPRHVSPCPSGFSTLPNCILEEECYRITNPNLKPAILIRSASLEEIPLARHERQKELRGTQAVIYHSEDEAIEDMDNEIIHHWRMSSARDTGVSRMTESRGPEMSLTETNLASLHSAERMLNHLICNVPFSEERGQSAAEGHGWAGGIPDEVMKGERTQL